MRRTRQLLYSEESLRLELLTTPIHRIPVSIESSPMLSEAINKVRADMERMMIKRSSRSIISPPVTARLPGRPISVLAFMTPMSVCVN